jgi:LysM repeat protein
MKSLKFTFVAAILLLTANQAQGQTLKGSPASVKKQYTLAQSYGFRFIQTPNEVAPVVNSGKLQRVSANRHLELHSVSYPYAVAETKLFLDRLSQQYQSACGEKLTVTSLLRPANKQPANSVARSVHPTGMAVDLRIPAKGNCRSWLENTLLILAQAEPVQQVAVSSSSVQSGPEIQQANYVVRRGDSLWEISVKTGVSVAALRSANNLRGNRIDPGQTLTLPDATHSSTLLASNNVITHRVNRGESLWTIANRYGTSVKKIQQVNHTGKVLKVGQVLTIYGG